MVVFLSFVTNELKVGKITILLNNNYLVPLQKYVLFLEGRNFMFLNLQPNNKPKEILLRNEGSVEELKI